MSKPRKNFTPGIKHSVKKRNNFLNIILVVGNGAFLRGKPDKYLKDCLLFIFYFSLISVFFTIQCGPKRATIERTEKKGLIIGKIEFIGAKAIKESQLKKAMRIINEGEPYNKYRIKVGLENVISFYRTKGFFHAKIISKKGNLSLPRIL